MEDNPKPRSKWRSLAAKAAWSILGFVIWAAVPVGLLLLSNTLTQSSVPATLGNSRTISTHSWDDLGLVQATGTWVMENEQIGSPINEVRIGCYRDLGYCFVATAELMPMGTARPMLVADLARFPISRWDRDVIVFSESNGCVTYSVTISRVSESITARREPDTNPGYGACTIPMDAVLLTSVQDGHAVWRRLTEEEDRHGAPWFWATLGAWSLYILWRLIRLWLAVPAQRPLRASVGR